MKAQRNTDKYSSSIYRQHGASLLSILLMLLIGGLLVTCVLKMGPVYLENWNFRTILTDLESQFTETGVSDKADIRRKIQKRMNIDMIDALKPEDVTIQRDGDHYVVEGNYESRVELLGNVDVVMKFENQVKVPLN